MDEVGKIGDGVVLRKRSINYFHTNLFQCYLPLTVWCVCVLFIYTISISIIWDSQEELKFYYNRCHFLKWIIFEKKRNCGKWIFDITELLNLMQIAVMRAQQMVLIYLYIGVSVFWPLSVMCVFVWLFRIKSEYQLKNTLRVRPQYTWRLVA